VDDVEGSGVPLAVDDGANSSGVTTTGDHAKIAGLELDEVHNLVSVDVQTERVVDLIEKRTSLKTFSQFLVIQTLLEMSSGWDRLKIGSF